MSRRRERSGSEKKKRRDGRKYSRDQLSGSGKDQSRIRKERLNPERIFRPRNVPWLLERNRATPERRESRRTFTSSSPCLEDKTLLRASTLQRPARRSNFRPQSFAGSPGAAAGRCLRGPPSPRCPAPSAAPSRPPAGAGGSAASPLPA